MGREAAFSIGYRRVKARRSGDVRELHDVELYEVSPVLHGAHPDARLIGVKAGRPSGVEYKATSGVVAAQRRRAGAPAATACSVCGRPAAAVVPGGLRRGESLICRRCVEEAAEGTTTDTATIDVDDLIDAYRLTDPELTSEQEYDAALDNEQEWHLRGDGTLARGPRNPWGGNRGAARGPWANPRRQRRR